MDRAFLTNRNTIIFYCLLSAVVFPFGMMNLYRMLTSTGDYWIGFKSLLAPLLPLLTFLSWRHGRLFVQADGLKLGKDFYPSASHRFALGSVRHALKDRPLTSLWKRDYDVLNIVKNGAGTIRTVSLEMSQENIRRLAQAIGVAPTLH